MLAAEQVAQLAGYVSEHSAYHHGEASLCSTIVGLAQDFVGSNNVNLLYPSGEPLLTFTHHREQMPAVQVGQSFLGHRLRVCKLPIQLLVPTEKQPLCLRRTIRYMALVWSPLAAV